MTARPDWVVSLIDAASAPYREAGRFAWHFARGKLGGDPAFRALLERGLIPGDGRLLDLGCGQGLLASWLLAARDAYDAGAWPVHVRPPPLLAPLDGIELMARDVDRARIALADRAQFAVGDIRSTPFGLASVVVILDVLHYLSYHEQDALLERVREALSPDGTLLLRVGDAAAGWPFHCSLWVDRAVTFARGHRLPRLWCRPLDDWIAALESHGFDVETIPMSEGTPFANVLLMARL